MGSCKTFYGSKAIDENRKGKQTVDLEVTGEISASGGIAGVRKYVSECSIWITRAFLLFAFNFAVKIKKVAIFYAFCFNMASKEKTIS